MKHLNHCHPSPSRLIPSVKKSCSSTSSSSSSTPLRSSSSIPPLGNLPRGPATGHGSHHSVLLCSMGIIWAVRYTMDVEGHLGKMLEREKEDGKLLGKCAQELKKKGVGFDLLKEVDALRRAKSMRMEVKVVRQWSSRDFVTLFFFTVSCLVLGFTRVILCS
ncbi:hypothetical protein SLEP1_g54381 [Rubroshorea leprosula]|uniref:Uncharacterized protein n=1 Tax=Rubroshorea leprosula TaxID=152421 RepID=A0AAV5MCN6_9ROSI|nr:hypothetical protein SLEP1_g54381 [Rubroshorea leprosula]